MIQPVFAHRRAGHCGSGALRDLLEFHSLDFGHGPLGEEAVFGLGGGLGAFYATHPGAAHPIYLVGRSGGLERDVAEQLDAVVDVHVTDDPDLGWWRVAEAVDAGLPPLVWADIARLDYLRVRMSNTRHAIVVCGYDLDRELVWIADNDRDELQPCAFESLAAARASDSFPGPNRHTSFHYSWPRRLPEPRISVRRGLRRAVGNMRQPEPIAELSGAVGLAAIDAFCADYPTWPETLAAEVDTALDALWVFIVKAGTGGAMFRSLHAGFLRDFADLLDHAGLRRAADAYDRLAQAWVNLARTAAKHDHAAGQMWVSEIGHLEHHGVALMEDLL